MDISAKVTPPAAGSRTARRFRAFICYSRADHLAATRLHRRLEAYRVPSELVGRAGRWGKIPPTLGPVFRDREELAAAADIGARLREALEAADFLVVLCSPAAASSSWVEAEIATFCGLGPERRERVLAVVLAGDPAAGGGQECFPPALRGALGAGSPLGRGVPLAADFRVGSEPRRDSELRLIAALLGTGFDDLRQREAERRVRGWRRIVALAALLVAGFAGLAVYALAQRAEARRAAARATVARAEAEKLVDFMLTDLRERLTAIGKLELLRPANEKIRAYYENIAPGDADTEGLRRRAAAFYQHGMDLRNLKNVAAALAALERAAELGERLAALEAGDAAGRLILADTRRLLANQRQEAGDTKGALRELAEAERGLQEVALLKPTDTAIPMRIAGLKAEEAESLMRSGQTVRAVERLEEALRTLEDLLAREPKLVGLADRSIAVAWKLGMTRRRMGDLPRAEEALRRSLALATAWRDAAPDDIVRLRRHQLSLSSLGSVLSEAGRVVEALAVQREALNGAREISERDPANLVYADTVATALSNVSGTLIVLDRQPEARPVVQEMVVLYEQMLARGSTDGRTRTGLAMALASLSATESALGNHEEALKAGRRAVALSRERSEADPVDVKLRDDYGYVRFRLGSILSTAGRWGEATEEFNAALAIMDEVIRRDAGNPQLVRKGERAQWQATLGYTQVASGAHAAARATLTEVLTALQALERAGLPAAAQAATRQRASEELAKLPPP